MTTVKAYSVAGTGYYKSNRGFVNDANAALPQGWTNASGAGCTATVIASAGTHNKVFELYDNSGANQINVVFSPPSVTYGTVEWYWRTSDVTKSSTIDFLHGVTEALYLTINASKFRYYDNTGEHDSGVAAVNDTWYRMRVDFECTAGGYQGLAQYKWHFYIDGTHYGDYGFGNNQDHIDTIKGLSHPANTGYYAYIDAWANTWEGNYTVGDLANAYDTVVYRHAKARRGTHESHHDFSAFDITKMVFPSQI